MSEDFFKTLAEQLRKPTGDLGKTVGEKMNESNKLMNLESIECLNIQANQQLLEIGMGNGFFVQHILTQHPSVIYNGCDFSAAMVKEAIAINKHFITNGQAAFVQANAHQLPYAEAQFDTVFTVNTIYFWDDVAAVLSAIKRVLKPQGQLVLALRPKEVMEHFPFTPHGFTLYTQADCLDLLAQHGFKIVNTILKQEADLVFFEEPVKNAYLIIQAVKQ
ncbi:MAG: class I SAM-dependent methyltransferase [Bacteroidota bacterium]